MVSKQPRPRLLKSDRAHFVEVQAAVIGSFNFWAKPKAKPAFVVALAGEIAELAVTNWRKRTERTGK